MEKLTFTLKACRVNRNITIAEVALKVGRTERTVINWEKYKTTPDASELRMLSSIYGVPEDCIFLGDKSALNRHYTIYSNIQLSS